MRNKKIIKDYTINGICHIPDIDFINCDFCNDYPENPIKVETKDGLIDPYFCPMCGKRLVVRER